MICPDCASQNTYCYVTRQRKKWRLRRYKCADCGGRFTTEERIRPSGDTGQSDVTQPDTTKPSG